MEQSPEQEREKKLRESLDKSSTYNRNQLAIYLGLLAYVIITAATTTDMMLLIGTSKIKLPVLSSEIPILDFYKFTPWVVLIFHLYLLINLYLHTSKYVRWLNTRDNNQSYLATFLFNHSYQHEHLRIIRLAINLMIMALYYFLPLLSLIWTAYKFLPYHHKIITPMHNIIITMDGIISLYFY